MDSSDTSLGGEDTDLGFDKDSKLVHSKSNCVSTSGELSEPSDGLNSAVARDGKLHSPQGSTHIVHRLLDGRAIKSAKASISHHRKLFTTHTTQLQKKTEHVRSSAATHPSAHSIRQLIISSIGCPCTSVKRRSIPLCRQVSFVCSIPMSLRMVA